MIAWWVGHLTPRHCWVWPFQKYSQNKSTCLAITRPHRQLCSWIQSMQSPAPMPCLFIPKSDSDKVGKMVKRQEEWLWAAALLYLREPRNKNPNSQSHYTRVCSSTSPGAQLEVQQLMAQEPMWGSIWYLILPPWALKTSAKKKPVTRETCYMAPVAWNIQARSAAYRDGECLRVGESD